jgi:hypothetical protein
MGFKSLQYCAISSILWSTDKNQRMNITAQLKALAGNYDTGAMDTLVESLLPAELAVYKQEIIDAYETVYSYGLYDLDCDKVSDPEDFIFYLLDIIASIQRFFPDQMYYKERGYCYQNLSDRSVAYAEKLRYINEAIQIYTLAPQTTDMQMAMVSVLTDKMEITKQFTTAAFTELLGFFRPVLVDPAFVKPLIHWCFRVQSLQFEERHYWHRRLLAEFEVAMDELAANNPLVLLEWAETYHYLLFHDSPEIELGYKISMVAKTASLLRPLEGYYTEDAELLNRLGKAFADTAKRSTDNNQKLEFYSISVDFFTKGHEQQPAAWTFPVYATNSLLGMAHVYHEQGAYEKLINTFERGLQLFARVYHHEEDFQLNLYWGDFLLEYAGLAYDYKSPSINHLAEEKLRRSAVLGRNAYSHPYISMARLAIRSGDKEKCIELLLQCRDAMRSTGYDGYDLGEAIDDDDFREVRDHLV